MNRSILIVICDFLLVSLLAFSTVDINQVADKAGAPRMQANIATNAADAGRDLTSVMKLALDEEKKNRDRLLGELEKTRAAAGRQQSQLAERERQMQASQQESEAREQRARQEAAALQLQYAAAQTNIQALNQQLQQNSAATVLSGEKLAATEAELRKRADEAAALQQQLADLARSNQAALGEKEKLAAQLQVAEVEKRHASEQAAQAQQQVQVERAEKAKLAEGVKVLANKSGELAEEIRENRPLTANTIFNEFASNRVSVAISATRPGVFSENSRRKEAITVLATDGTNTYALCHVEDTPLVLFNPGTDWRQVDGTIGRDRRTIPIHALSFQFRDPRIVWMPVSAADAKAIGTKVYRFSADPYKFQDAVLVGANEGYYGECKFEIDLTTPEHVRLDRSVLKGIFGKFNPSRGDLVFSKQGELLGVMANNTYCMMMRNFDAGATIPFGEDMRIGMILSDLANQVRQMPVKLQ